MNSLKIGEQTLTVSYFDTVSGNTLTATFTVTVVNDSISNISVKTNPTKTSYYVGETLDVSGLTLTATYSSGRTETISSGYICSPTTLNTAGTQTITVSYSGKTTTFSVTVANDTIKSIVVKTMPNKTSYYVGDTLDTAGLTLTATYASGKTETISSGYICSPTALNTAGTQTITVSYTEGGVTKTATFTVTVVEPVYTSLAVTTKPDKLTYVVGELLDTVGMVVTATYSNGSTRTVTGWSCSPTTFATAGTVMITVSYTEGGITKTATFPVTVVLRALSSILITKQPTKTVYDLNEPFDPSGIEVMAVYNDGSTEDVTSACIYTGFDSSTSGTKAVTVSYLDMSAPLFVSVIDDVTAPKISVSSATGAPGETVTLDVSLSNNPGINSFALSFVYDTSALELLSVTPNANLGGTFSYSKRASWLNAADITYNGPIMTLTFKIKDTAEKGQEYPVTVSYSPGGICNYNEDDVFFKIAAGSITIGDSHIPGDINGDGTVNNKDLTRLLKYISGENVTVVESALDVNGDGNVNNKDLTRLLKYISGENVFIY